MSGDIHPYKCPACETAIRATNYEGYYEQIDKVVPAPLEVFESDVSPGDDAEQQLWYCPNDGCRIVRLLPGDDSQ